MRNINLLLTCILVILVVWIPGHHSSSILSAVSLLAVLILLLTFYPVVRSFLGPVESLVFALPAGYCFHALALSLLGKWFGVARPAFLIYFVAVVLLSAFFMRRSALKPSTTPPKGPSWESIDTLLLLTWLILITCAVSLPLLHFGAETPKGIAYRAYFNTDTLRHMAVTASLKNTGVPPENFYFGGVVHHYYWFFQILPAYWLRLIPSFPLSSVMVQFNLIIALLFGASLFTALRRFTVSRKSLVLIFPVFLAGCSYEGLYVLYKLRQMDLPWYAFSDWNIDAILRWFWNAPQMDAFFRPLLYGPQHLIALSVFLLGLVILRNGTDLRTRMFFYFLLFSTVGFSIIIGAILILGFGALLLAEMVRKPRETWLELILSGLLGLAFLALYFFLFQMFSPASGDLRFGLNHQIVQNIAGYFILNWGAVLLLGLAGFFYRSGTMPMRTLFFFFSLCLVFIFFVNLDVPGHSEITHKGGFVAALVLLFTAAGFLDRILSRKAGQTFLLSAVVILLVIPGCVTWLMDLHNSQDIGNQKFTTYVQHEDAALYRWMKQHLEPGATVQNYSLPGEGFLEDYVSEIPALAERGLYLGDKVTSRIYQIPEEQVKQRETIVWKMFHLSSPGQISTLTQRAGIEYVVLGSRDTLYVFEKHLREPYFTPVHREGNARLYRVNKREISVAEMEQTILVQEPGGEVLLEAHFGERFYPPEMQTGLETARWLSNDALVSFESTEPMDGTLSFTAHAFSHGRKMQIYLGNELALERGISPAGTRVAFPVRFPPGKSILRIHCVEAPGQTEGDNRLLSFRVWNLQFKQQSTK